MPRTQRAREKAAFTLRLDAERHLRPRLMSAVTNRSAQTILTELLDDYLSALPEIDAMASRLPAARPLRSRLDPDQDKGGPDMNRNMADEAGRFGLCPKGTTTGRAAPGVVVLRRAVERCCGQFGGCRRAGRKARAALEDGKVSKAVGLAEAAVAASSRDGHYRAAGQAYLNDGRFASATDALSEAMELGVKDSNTVLAMTLAHIAQGKTSQAVLLKENFDTVPGSPDLASRLRWRATPNRRSIS